MKYTFELLKASRQNVLKVMDGLSLEQLNRIPEGFGNNIIWNAGHCLVTQQLLCYLFSGLPMSVSQEMIDKYRKGSRPAEAVGAEEVEQIKKLLIETAEKIESDFADGKFVNYKPYETSYGIGMKNAEEAIIFNNAHEAMHLGAVLALRKFV